MARVSPRCALYLLGISFCLVLLVLWISTHQNCHEWGVKAGKTCTLAGSFLMIRSEVTVGEGKFCL